MTILIVEDDASLLALFCATLAARGIEVVPAASSEEGLKLAAARPIDAALTDYELPELNGIQFCRAFLQQCGAVGRQVPVWMMSGSIALTEQDAKDAGADDLFRKPFSISTISRIIEKRLREMHPLPGRRHEDRP